MSWDTRFLYAAFGDKHTLYLKVLERCWRLSLAAMREALGDGDQALGEALMRAYDGELSIYFPADGLPRGCFAIGTATSEAVEDHEIRCALAAGLRARAGVARAELREIGARR
jgi:TetR/AcrR family transcriptional regulator, copper-responsive repressor